MALDPSKGKDAHSGDYSALIKLGLDSSMVLYCEADLQRRPTPQLVADGVEMARSSNRTRSRSKSTSSSSCWLPSLRGLPRRSKCCYRWSSSTIR